MTEEVRRPTAALAAAIRVTELARLPFTRRNWGDLWGSTVGRRPSYKGRGIEVDGSKLVFVHRELEMLFKRRVAARWARFRWRSTLRRQGYDRIATVREWLAAKPPSWPFQLYQRRGPGIDLERDRLTEGEFFAALDRVRAWLQQIARGDVTAIREELAARKMRPDSCALGRELEDLLCQSEPLWPRLRQCVRCGHIYVDRAAGLTSHCSAACRDRARSTRERTQRDQKRQRYVARVRELQRQNRRVGFDAARDQAQRELGLTAEEVTAAWGRGRRSG